MEAFKRKDALKLINEYSKLKKQLFDVSLSEEMLKEKLRHSVDIMMDEEVLDILSDIPSEEVNRDKNGIKVKTLVDNGYLTLSDLAKESESALSDINGISLEGARIIKEVISNIEKKIREDLHLNLTKEARGADEVIRNAFIYKESVLKIEKIQKLLSDTEKQADPLINDLSPIKNGFKWLFTSKASKLKAQEAYKELSPVLSQFNGIGKIALDDIKFINSVSKDRCWQDFLSSLTKYQEVLDKEFPDLFRKDDTVYGLPKDLADGIKDETFSLKGLKASLRRYQEWGVKYILHQKRVLLGDEMGLGKTVQAIAVMVSMSNNGANYFLVIAPASVLSNWCKEIKKFCSLDVFKIHGDQKEEEFKKWKEKGGIAVTTFETTAFIMLSLDLKIDLLIVDEAHYIKNPKAQRSANVAAISANSDSILFMTGTAMENKVDEMINLISLLDPKIAKEAKSIAFLSNAPKFRDCIAPVYYRRKREDVLKELPELIESMDWCELLPQEEKIYERSILENNFAQVRRVSWNVDDISNSSKAKRLLEIVEDAFEDDRKVLIFSFFLDTVAKVKELLKDSCLPPITGACSPQERQEIVDNFSLSEKPCALVAQIQSGGVGLNIQEASVVIICEPQFKPSIENQAVSRAYRMGQKRSVLVHRLLCEDTVDEKIVELLEKKQREFDAFADESSAANESLKLDNNGFIKIIDEERKRIEEKNRSVSLYEQANSEA